MLESKFSGRAIYCRKTRIHMTYLNCLPLIDIVDRVRAGESPPYRPVMPESDCEKMEQMKELAEDCWTEDPEQRPSIETVVVRIRKING